MVPRRILAATAALACVGGMVVSSVLPGVAHASAASRTTAVPRTLPPHVFAPYYLNTADTLAATSKASGAKYLTLAFLQTAKPGSCTVDWNGDSSMPVGKAYAAGIAAVQAAGGNVVPSFGGASADSADEEIADSCHSVPAIAGQYEKVITAYHVTRLDLDTEEDSLNNYAGIDRRNKAIALVEAWARRTRRTVQFVYTIPTNTTGTDQGGSYVLQNAVANGAQIAIVNIMTFDYYDYLPHEMANNTEGAAQQLYDRLHGLYPGKGPSQLWGMIGVTEDLGVDDFGPAETFTLADARTVERWAAARGLAELSFWNVQDDNKAGSQQKQTPYEYSRIFEPFTSSAPVRSTALDAPAAAAGAVDPVRGNMRSVSCPSPSFCQAVDESGNNALRWDGTSWSVPVSIDPGGTRVEMTSVSCASALFCAAVDTRGRVMTWNGASWSAPRAIDPDGAGLTSVSCPSAAFCVADDGDGDALRWDGARWSAPDRIDSSGASVQSVSCASASFCAAGDWNGNVLTWNGERWSAPDAVDPTTDSTGGGIGSMSCPTSSFCVGLDWEGGKVTWNGATWRRNLGFDPNGAGGLMSVSCSSATFCVAVDGSGDYRTWYAGRWIAAAEMDPDGGGLESVSCASDLFCMAVDWNGSAQTWLSGTWRAPAILCPDSNPTSAGTCYKISPYVDPRTGVLDAVSCPSATFCAAVDGNGNALTGGSPHWQPTRIDPIAGILTSVSCASPKFCAAVDTNGRAVTWNGLWLVRPWSAANPVDPHGGGLTGVSCATATFCAAVDGNGNALRWNGKKWSAPDRIDASGLAGVSCPSAAFCLAVDDAGRALRWNGSRWTAAARIDGSALTAVSCADRSFCVAVDARGDAVRWNGARWSAPARVDAAGLTGVSCARDGFCAVVAGNGDALVSSDGARRWSRVLADRTGGGFTGVSCFTSACVAVDFAGNAVVIATGRPA
jgi:uncharacterized Fe-S cluster protein YjdI